MFNYPMHTKSKAMVVRFYHKRKIRDSQRYKTWCWKNQMPIGRGTSTGILINKGWEISLELQNKTAKTLIFIQYSSLIGILICIRLSFVVHILIGLN